MNEIYTAIASSIFGIVVAFLSSKFYTNQAKADLQKEFESRFNERKWDVYYLFATEVAGEVLKGGAYNQKKVLDSLARFTSQIQIVGSDEVVRVYSEWLRYIRKQTPMDTVEHMCKLYTIFIEMRKDLGYGKTQVKPVDLLGIFLTDIEHYAEELEKKC